MSESFLLWFTDGIKCLCRDTSNYFIHASRSCLHFWMSKALFSQQQMRRSQFGQRSSGLIRYQNSRYASGPTAHIYYLTCIPYNKPSRITRNLFCMSLLVDLCILQLLNYRKLCWQMIAFKGTSMLEKPVPKCRIINQDEADPDDIPLQWWRKQSHLSHFP